jgi:hypothetical protein
MTSRSQQGFVAAEWVAALALLMLPVVVLVATLPDWAERRHTATVAAREATRVLAREWPHAEAARAVTVALEVAADHGLDGDDVDIDVVSPGVARGDLARVRVRVTMPAVSVLGITAGAWMYTAVAVRRIDDYRSR